MLLTAFQERDSLHIITKSQMFTLTYRSLPEMIPHHLPLLPPAHAFPATGFIPPTHQARVLLPLSRIALSPDSLSSSPQRPQSGQRSPSACIAFLVTLLPYPTFFPHCDVSYSFIIFLLFVFPTRLRIHGVRSFVLIFIPPMLRT